MGRSTASEVAAKTYGAEGKNKLALAKPVVGAVGELTPADKELLEHVALRSRLTQPFR